MVRDLEHATRGLSAALSQAFGRSVAAALGVGYRPPRMQSPQTGSSARFRVLFLLFFLSGISGLIYESIWSRYIKQFVGSAATAQILVLSLFMGGMSLGALLSGRFVARTRSPVVVYGVIEGLIGVYALAFPHIADFTMRLAYDSLFPALGGGTAVEVAKWSMAGMLILPPCVLLGT